MALGLLHSNVHAQAVSNNHDINLGPDLPFCENSTYTFNPFVEQPDLAQSCSYTQSAIPYAPDSYTTGTQITGMTDDCKSKYFPIGFKFDFFCGTYNYFRLNSNAILTLVNPPQNANATNFPQGQGCYTGAGSSVCEPNYTWNLQNSGSLGQATNQLPLNAIFFCAFDINPGLGGQIRWELTGTAPYRKLTIKYKDVPYFSCTTQLINIQMMMYETTNVIEVHVLKKQNCAWNGNLGVVGLQGQFTNQFCSVPGFNNQSFQFNTSKAWRFTPSGAIPPPPTLPITIKWKKLPSGPITYGNSISITPQVGVTTCYTAELVRNNAAHSPLVCGSNTTPDTVCFYPSFISSSVTYDSLILCNSACNATASINTTYGFPNWNFYLNNLQGDTLDSLVNTVNIAHTFNNLCAGSYVIKAIDSIGCSSKDTITIMQLDSVKNIITHNSILCFGNLTGVITIDSTWGGTGPYTYSLDGINFQSNGTFSSLASGQYVIHTKDFNNCVRFDTVFISQPLLLTLASNQVNVDCFSNSTGSIQLTASGGVTPYTFSCASVSNSTGTYGNLAANTYACNVIDNNGCVSAASIIITQPNAALLGTITSQTNVSCNGLSNASITIQGSGGTTPYNFNLNTGINAGSIPNQIGNNASFSSLQAGIGTIIITDNNGCTTTVSIDITQPNVLILITDSVIPVDCFGNNSGKICLSTTGGTGPFDFSITGTNFNDVGANQITYCSQNLYTGNYTIVVNDANNCSATTNEFVSEPAAALSFTITSVDSVSCTGGSDGNVNLTVTGGTTPYSYNVSPSSSFVSTLPLTGINAGDHYITVKDINGCIAIDSVTILQPSLPLQLVLDNIDTVTCNGFNNGCIYVHAIPGTGTPSYTYALSSTGPFNASSTFCGLTANTYNVFVKDYNNCITSVLANVTEPPVLTVSITTDSVNCFNGSDGCSFAFAAGGVLPYHYYWQSSPIEGASVFCGQSAVSNANYQVLDDNGCSAAGTYTIAQPNPITTQLTDTINTCTFDSLKIGAIAIGGTPSYMYHWTCDTTVFADSLKALPKVDGVNTVYLVVSDAYNCLSKKDSILLIVRPKPVSAITSLETSGCEPYCIPFLNNTSINTTLGDYIQSSFWEFGDGYNQGSLIADHCYENDGSYTVCLTSTTQFGCKNKVCNPNYITIYPKPETVFYADPDTADMFAPNFTFTNQLVPFGIYYWNFGDGTDDKTTNPIDQITHTYADTGSYDVMMAAQSLIGCLDTAYQTVVVEEFFTVYIPSAFTPNDDYKNPKFVIQGESIKTFNLKIFNRFGQLIFEQKNIGEEYSWDGAGAPEGIYNYELIVGASRGKPIRKSGMITLIK